MVHDCPESVTVAKVDPDAAADAVTVPVLAPVATVDSAMAPFRWTKEYWLPGVSDGLVMMSETYAPA